MGDHPPSPHLMPPPSSLSKSNMSILYYGLVVVGTAAIVLALYNLIVLKWCTDFSTNRYSQRAMITGRGSSRRYRNLNLDLVFSFKYKNGVVAEDTRNESECAVCLSVFQEDEEVRQLRICKHSFHAPCIDMWLYSHVNCPICRCSVEPPVLHQSAAMGQLEQSTSMVVPPDIQLLAATEQSLHPPHVLQGTACVSLLCSLPTTILHALPRISPDCHYFQFGIKLAQVLISKSERNSNGCLSSSPRRDIKNNVVVLTTLLVRR